MALASADKRAGTATTIGRGSRVRGQVEGAEDIIVDGRVDGGIRLDGSLTVREDGVVVANVTAHEVTVAGILVGDVVADGAVHVESSGKLVGDVKAGRLVIAAGGAMRGNVDTTEEPSAARRSARAERGERRETTSAFAAAAPRPPMERLEAPPAPPRPAVAGKKKLTRRV